MYCEVETTINRNPDLSSCRELAALVCRVPLMAHRLNKIVDRSPEDLRVLLRPKKTVSISFVAIERYSLFRLDEINRKGLVVPGILAFNALASEWDDAVDSSDRSIPECRSEEMWSNAIEIINKSRHVDTLRKPFFLNELESAKVRYMESEMELKQIETGSYRPTELLGRVIELRDNSFGNITRVMTRIFTGGLKYPVLEERMVNVTKALGLLDGILDLKEDARNHTMTEARAARMVDADMKLPKNTTALKLASFYLNGVSCC